MKKYARFVDTASNSIRPSQIREASMQVLSEIYLIERVYVTWTSPFLLCEVTQSHDCCHTGERRQ